MANRRAQLGMVGGGARRVERFPTVPPPPPPPMPDDPGPKRTRSPLTDTFPVFKTLRAGFGAIPSPNAGFSIPVGQMGLYPLLNVRADEFSQQDVLLTAVHCVLGSGHAGGGGSSAWGSASGIGAAILVGVNMPNLKPATGSKGDWSAGKPPVPYVDTAAGVVPIVLNDTRYVFCSPFAPGLQGTGPSRVDPAEDFPPHVLRLKPHDRIQAAFVLNRAHTNAAAGTLSSPFLGICEVRVRLGMTFTDQGLART